MTNSNTIIENVEYFSMDDTKNSRYLDAEKFDPNFPLACSYKSYRVHEEIYNYFNVISEYYRVQKNICVLIIESKYPHELANNYFDDRKLIEYSVPPTDSEFEIIEREGRFDYFLNKEITVGRHFFPERKFMFSLTERINNVFYTRFLFCTKFDGSSEELKSKYFTSPESSSIPNRGFPYLQTIATQDWDLIKRYLFFMIRNHQYKYAELIYYLKQLANGSYYYPEYADDDTFDLFCGLPEDLRRSSEKRVSRGIASCELVERGDGLLRGGNL